MEAVVENGVQFKSSVSKQAFDVTDITGDDGPWQRRISVFISLLHTIAALQSFAMSFLAPNIDHWCTRPPEAKNLTVEQWRTLGMPPEDQHCSRYEDINFISLNRTSASGNSTIPCQSWEYDTTIYSSSVLSQFDLVCDQKWMVSMAKSVFFAGVFSNVILGHISDWMGRRPVIIICGIIAISAGVGGAFSTSFTLFLICRFFMPLGSSMNTSTSFIYMMEISGPKYRNIYGNVIPLGYTLGMTLLPLIAWLIADSFWIQIAISLPFLLNLAAFWLPESPRWLLNKGKIEEAENVLFRAAKINGINVSEDKKVELRKRMTEKTETSKLDVEKAKTWDLLKTPGLRKITLIIFYTWGVNGIVYHGLSQNTNELAGDPFVNFALYAVVEIPAYLFVIVTIEKLGKRNLIGWSMIFSGIVCFVTYLLPSFPLMRPIDVYEGYSCSKARDPTYTTSRGVNGIVYHGLSQNTNELAGDPFVNFALYAVVEIPAYLFVVVTIEKLGKRNLIGCSMIFSGIVCFVTYLLPSYPWWLSTAFSIIGKFFISISYGTIYIYGSEVFPTVARNIGVVSASAIGKILTIAAPFMRELGDTTHPIVPQIILAVLAVSNGILIFLLPDTRKFRMPDTLEEAEKYIQ